MLTNSLRINKPLKKKEKKKKRLLYHAKRLLLSHVPIVVHDVVVTHLQNTLQDNIGDITTALASLSTTIMDLNKEMMATTGGRDDEIASLKLEIQQLRREIADLHVSLRLCLHEAFQPGLSSTRVRFQPAMCTK